MDGHMASGGTLKVSVIQRLSDLERMIAHERSREAPDEALIRRMCREVVLQRDRMAALGGCAMPRWAREEA